MKPKSKFTLILDKLNRALNNPAQETTMYLNSNPEPHIPYLGTAGDSFAYHRGAPFSTKDKDNDADSRHCAVTFKGGWWYISCRHANLNGLYHHGQHSSHADGINWQHWKGDNYSAKRSEMKIRPADF